MTEFGHHARVRWLLVVLLFVLVYPRLVYCVISIEQAFGTGAVAASLGGVAIVTTVGLAGGGADERLLISTTIHHTRAPQGHKSLARLTSWSAPCFAPALASPAVLESLPRQPARPRRPQP
jgi:hypothetical protein